MAGNVVSMGRRVIRSPEAYSLYSFCLRVSVKALDKPKLCFKENPHCFFCFFDQNCVSKTDVCNTNSESCTWPL